MDAIFLVFALAIDDDHSGANNQWGNDPLVLA